MSELKDKALDDVCLKAAMDWSHHFPGYLWQMKPIRAQNSAQMAARFQRYKGNLSSSYAVCITVVRDRKHNKSLLGLVSIGNLKHPVIPRVRKVPKLVKNSTSETDVSNVEKKKEDLNSGWGWSLIEGSEGGHGSKNCQFNKK